MWIETKRIIEHLPTQAPMSSISYIGVVLPTRGNDPFYKKLKLLIYLY